MTPATQTPPEAAEGDAAANGRRPATDDEIRRVAAELRLFDDSSRRRITVITEAGDADDEDGRHPSQQLAEYLKTKPHTPPSLVKPEGLVVRGGVHVTVARSGKGKTVYNVNRLIAWGAGRALFPDAPVTMTPVKPLKSLIVENEGSGAMFHKQVTRMIEHAPGFTDEQRALATENVNIWGDGGFSDMQLDHKGRRALLLAEIERVRPDILFMEPMRMFWSGEENSATAMDEVLKAMQRIAADYDIAFMTAHHAKKGESDDDLMSMARGSTALEGTVSLMEHMKHNATTDEVAVEFAKIRYQEEYFSKTFSMKWNVAAHWYEYIGEGELAEKLLRIIESAQGKQLSTVSAAESAGLTGDTGRRTAHRALTKAADKKPPRVVRFSVGKDTWWRIPSPEADDEGLSY